MGVTVESLGSRTALERLTALVHLTKPRIVELLLITTVPAMVLAAGGWPGTGLVVATVIGGALSAGGANALNCYFDRDIDRVMHRTSRRPLPRQQVAPREAAWLGCSLGATGFLWLATLVNLLSALLATAALVFYVAIYTRWLKRSTTQNIVIGGAAGAAPALIGWAAVTASIGLPAWILFLVIFYWTPTHFWALALRYRSQYAAASVPMLPVIHGVTTTTMHMLAYSALTVAASLLLIPAAGMGWFYAAAAALLGGWLLAETWAVNRSPDRAMTLFLRSTYHLALLFGAVAADVFISG